MFKLILATVFITLAVAAAKNNDTITKFVSQVNSDGTYGYEVEQSSGVEYKEAGFGGHYANGAYQYVSPEGKRIAVVYTADETGFHPKSDSIPTPPPIPAYILKALEYIREHPTIEELADRKVRAKQV
ncbi:pupal cuticle protein Edg-78E [Lucilia sericata]|uniref:pupal cuticle protein Edg-78E n=1 Tax=Lucilia sericata TaxID=13632 RepID=UPI0018A873FC|nr:pupal cuticle protein Edg-78E [Lucilia sericata]